MPTLTKLNLEEGKDSLVPRGHSTTAPLMFMVDWEDPSFKTKLESIQGVEVGRQLSLSSLRGYHITSRIKEILLSSENRVVFRTETSLYELTN